LRRSALGEWSKDFGSILVHVKFPCLCWRVNAGEPSRIPKNREHLFLALNFVSFAWPGARSLQKPNSFTFCLEIKAGLV
jgi:hypothetical protein